MGAKHIVAMLVFLILQKEAQVLISAKDRQKVQEKIVRLLRNKLDTISYVLQAQAVAVGKRNREEAIIVNSILADVMSVE